MAYQAFYNKYRPQKFEEVVGQKTIVETLKNAIREDKIAHAYLFCGPRGTGKTTMARLFAKALNCKEGLGHQCDECESCVGIMKGEQPDVFEIDGASNSSVNDIRQLIENVSYQPIMSRYKVYIIDEVHNISNDAFNALLKTLEEPPSFVIFILATTEPNKIIPTILSRVQRFDFSKVSDKDLVNNMKRVLDSESIQYEEEALRLVASLADGGVRDSLSLLDKLVSYCGGERITVKDVNEMLGLLSLQDELDLVNNIADKKAKECLTIIKEKYEQGMDISHLHDDLIRIYKDFIVYQTTKDESLLDRLKVSEIHTLNVSLNEAKINIQTLLEAKREYRNTDDVFSHFQLTILNLIDPIVTAATPAPAKEKTAGDKADIKASTLSSVPVEVKSSNTEKGVTFEAKKEDKKDDDRLHYTIPDILNLMIQAKKDERTELSNKWNMLNDLAYDPEFSFEAKALISCKIRLVACNVAVVSCEFQTEISKINTKTAQVKLKKIFQKQFGKDCNVLPILETEFKDAYLKYKNGERPAPTDCTIDFGSQPETSSATDFFNDLMN